ncbi:hypothetical protein RclHR1_01140015 [Rhizophagus clarus]|uniref:Kinase-like domain-containing protein n=1 Tax=Rhizophagus clarus TaxID=94130 RepID=A0A2Z6QX59_9GLOM|nr:hypothetical protein RclHR1_01140015 [Rhizophagus clarus]GES97887.1 kinase-like domain-containing protein [Rhizophagus clarus]
MDSCTCQQGSYFCKPCDSGRFRDNFARWSSGDSNLDELIQNSQLEAYDPGQLIEWIDYSNLENMEYIAKGGYGSIYKAIWKDGPIVSNKKAWDINKSEWRRQNCTEVAIKKFKNTTCINSEHLNEINISLKMCLMSGGINTIRIYGVTRDPQNGEYAIVTEFKNGGNLRELIRKYHNDLTWEAVLNIFYHISEALDYIHVEEYNHKDLHSGNILNSIESDKIMPVISDFGLCHPIDKNSTDKEPYGVLPFVAPEVLRGGKFTKEADIYGIGMIMSEVISGESPFVDREYDMNLSLAICNGQRPQIPEYTPKPYVTLMNRCWDPDPTNRPTSFDLCKHFSIMRDILRGNSNLNLVSEEYKERVKEAFNQERENKWKARLAELAINPKPPKISQNLFTSKQLDYSQCLSQKLTVEDWMNNN